MYSPRRLKLAQQLARFVKPARKGFTLIELLVVVVIIGILASIALPSFLGAQDKARNASVQGGMNTVKMALEQYGTDNNGTYPTALTSAAGLLTNSYLPGNEIPRSPWANSGSQSSIVVIASGEVAASDVNAGSAMPDVGIKAVLGSGVVTADAGNINTVTDYGAISYDYDGGSQVYVLYGSGKSGKDAIIAAKSSNGGQ